MSKKKNKTKKRDWSKVKRTCKICGEKYEQGEMIRWEDGHICQGCWKEKQEPDWSEGEF